MAYPESRLETAELPSVLRRLEVLACPSCETTLDAGDGDGSELACPGCGRSYGYEEGVPRLFVDDEDEPRRQVGERVRAFYEKTPFPDYEDLDSAASLKARAREGIFARLLDEQVPDGARVLDLGCGTGQLTNFLALHPGRSVVGADACRSSLRLAEDFRRAHGIDNAAFVEMNLFRPALRPESFDLVISSGVLHHTAAPRRGFEALARLVRPGGYVAVGLYHRWGRLPTDLRRALFRLLGAGEDHGRLLGLDPRLRSAGLGAARRRAWFRDQYRHPHESKHTAGEVLAWLDACGLEYVGAVPSLRAFDSFSEDRPLFRPRPRPGALERFVAQAGMIASVGREGGLFLILGRKPRP